MNNEPPDILVKILKTKYDEIALRQKSCPVEQLREEIKTAPAVRGFFQHMKKKVDAGQAAVIAEIKKASPSKGIICHNFDPQRIAAAYARAGAACLSVLTDREYFQGCETYLQQAREVCHLPVIRKDFIIDPYQVYEARAIGADCILLIVAALDDVSMQALYDLATGLGMDVLIEAHDVEELKRALKVEERVVGINNRNLRTFDVSLQTTLDMLAMIPDRCQVVTESGIHTRKDVDLMQAHKVNSFLVGEAFMKTDEPGEALHDLFFS